jgi:hypothetical protein
MAWVVWCFDVCLFFLFGCTVVLCGCAVFAAWLCVLFCGSEGLHWFAVCLVFGFCVVCCVVVCFCVP